MSTDTISPRRAGTTAATRIACAASALFAVTLFATVASVNVPADVTDAELLVWWQDAGNQTSGIVSMFCGIAAAMLFIVVVNHVVSLLPATDGPGRLARFAHSAATAYTATMLVTAAVRGAVGYRVRVGEEPLPGVDVLRYATSLGYTLLDNVTMTTLALSIFAVSMAVYRTHVLGRWVAVLGIGCAVLIGCAVAASVGAFAIPLALLWALGLAIAIWLRPAV
jgi:hypothetical protein